MLRFLALMLVLGSCRCNRPRSEPVAPAAASIEAEPVSAPPEPSQGPPGAPTRAKPEVLELEPVSEGQLASLPRLWKSIGKVGETRVLVVSRERVNQELLAIDPGFIEKKENRTLYPWYLFVVSDSAPKRIECGFFPRLYDYWRTGYCEVDDSDVMAAMRIGLDLDDKGNLFVRIGDVYTAHGLRAESH